MSKSTKWHRKWEQWKFPLVGFPILLYGMAAASGYLIVFGASVALGRHITVTWPSVFRRDTG